MSRYNVNKYSEVCRAQEMNKISKALKMFEEAKTTLENAKNKYSEVVYNHCWRTWHYTSFDKFFENIISVNDLKNKKYNDLKVFENILNLEDKYFDLFSVSKNVIEFIEPKSIKDLTKVFAIGNFDSGEFLLERCQNTDAITDFIKPILKDTCNLILFDEQIKKILFKIFQNKQHANVMFKAIWQTRYKFDKYELKRHYEENGKFSIREFMQNQYFDIYYNYIGRPYLTIKNNLTEQNFDEREINKIFDAILWGVFSCCNEKKALQCAKYFYFVSEFALKNIPVELKRAELGLK